jgi:diacylglycerol kinase (CTP)
MSGKYDDTQNGALSLRSDVHLPRKIWHILTGLLGLYIHLNLSPSATFTATALLVISILAFTVEVVRIKVPKINKLVLKFMGPFMRECERTSFSGLPFYALGVSLALFLFDEKIAILASLFLIFADPVSSFFGILYGSTKILPGKSLEGSFAGFAVCYILTLVYGAVYSVTDIKLLLFAFFAGLVGAISELVSSYVDDNLSIPVVSGLGLMVLNNFFNIF